MNKKNQIAIVRSSKTAESIKEAVFSALDKIGAGELMKENQIVILKPNVLIAKEYQKAATTHPEVLRSVIRWVKQFNPQKIYVCDSSGGQRLGITEKALKTSGLQKVSEEEGAICIPFDKTGRREYPVENPLVLDKIIASDLLEKADIIINLPKVKTHGLCHLTCSIKNMFGTLILGNKAQMHIRFPKLNDFNQALVDIYSVSKPNITLVDGILGMEGNGPSQGSPVDLGIILAGYDPIAIDRTVCEIIGMNPDDVGVIKYGEQKGLGTSNLSEIDFVELKPEEVFKQFTMPKSGLNRALNIPLPKGFLNYLSKTIIKARLKFNPNKCKLCSTCWTECPGHAITPPKELKRGNIPTWDPNKCITCYCCAELCPHEAVDFEVNIAKNILHSGLGIGALTIVGIIIISSLLIIFL